MRPENKRIARATRPLVLAVSATDAMPVMSRDTTRGTTVMRNALSQSPPNASITSAAPVSPGADDRTNAPPKIPAAKAASTTRLKTRTQRPALLKTAALEARPSLINQQSSNLANSFVSRRRRNESEGRSFHAHLLR